MSLRLRLVEISYHLLLPRLARDRIDLIRTRAGLERISRRRPPADGTAQPLALGGVACTRFHIGQPDPTAIILYLHGGGHVLGSPRTHAPLLYQIARHCGLAVIASEHRLAPEHPYPAGLQDVLAVYHALQAEGHRRIILMGDSAGGNFVFALLHILCRHGRPPAAAVALSPWTDLSRSDRPAGPQGRREGRLVSRIMQRLIDLYAAPAQVRQPEVSPIYGHYPGAPPVLIQASASEPLLQDAHQIAACLRRDGVTVTLQTWPHAIHVFQALAPFLPEAREAIAQIGAFVRRTVLDRAEQR